MTFLELLDFVRRTIDLAEQVVVNEGALLETAWHLLRLLLTLLADVTATNNELVALFVGVAVCGPLSDPTG